MTDNTQDELCIICEKNPVDGELDCEECESNFWNDPQAVMEYFHFCGIPATLEEIKVMLSK